MNLRSGGPSRHALVALLALSSVCFAGAARGGRAAAVPCPGGGVICSHVVVPLDRTGRVPGKTTLFVETLPAQGRPRAALFLIAGGPGQSATDAFELAEQKQFYRTLFPDTTLVVMDLRGTGLSDALHCTDDCSASLGTHRGLYSSATDVQDIDAVRLHLGFHRIALYGVSYGTKTALLYAKAHPGNVSRLLLDSIAPPASSDLFATSTLQAIVPNLRHYCAAFGCNGLTPGAAADVVAVARRLEQAPEIHPINGSNGKRTIVSLTGISLLDLVVSSDLDPALAAELPAAIHAARLGRMGPLLRISALLNSGSGPDFGIDNARFVATTCSDANLPWRPGASKLARYGVLERELKALSSRDLGGFGRWAALEFGSASFCADWQGAPQSALRSLVRNPYPDVPVLALSGSYDMRTPTANARGVLAGFPHGHLLVVRGSGHSVLTSAPTPCLIDAVHRWFLGASVTSQCGTWLQLRPLGAFPAQTLPSGRYGPTRTLALAGATLQEAETTWLMLVFEGKEHVQAHGLDSGRLTSSGRTLVLASYSIAPGIAIDARLRVTPRKGKLVFTGPVKVTGRAASGGTLQLSEAQLTGTLEKQRVHAPVLAALSGLDAIHAAAPISALARG